MHLVATYKTLSLFGKIFMLVSWRWVSLKAGDHLSKKEWDNCMLWWKACLACLDSKMTLEWTSPNLISLNFVNQSVVLSPFHKGEPAERSIWYPVSVLQYYLECWPSDSQTTCLSTWRKNTGAPSSKQRLVYYLVVIITMEYRRAGCLSPNMTWHFTRSVSSSSACSFRKLPSTAGYYHELSPGSPRLTSYFQLYQCLKVYQLLMTLWHTLSMSNLVKRFLGKKAVIHQYILQILHHISFSDFFLTEGFSMHAHSCKKISRCFSQPITFIWSINNDINFIVG